MDKVLHQFSFGKIKATVRSNYRQPAMKYSFRRVVGVFFIFCMREFINTLDAKKIVFAEEVTAAAGTDVGVEKVEGGGEKIFENDHLLGKYFIEYSEQTDFLTEKSKEIL